MCFHVKSRRNHKMKLNELFEVLSVPTINHIFMRTMLNCSFHKLILSTDRLNSKLFTKNIEERELSSGSLKKNLPLLIFEVLSHVSGMLFSRFSINVVHFFHQIHDG